MVLGYLKMPMIWIQGSFLSIADLTNLHIWLAFWTKYKPLDRQFPLTHLQSPLHHVSPFPCGQYAQESSRKFPQLTLPKNQIKSNFVHCLTFASIFDDTIGLPTIFRLVHLTFYESGILVFVKIWLKSFFFSLNLIKSYRFQCSLNPSCASVQSANKAPKNPAKQEFLLHNMKHLDVGAMLK